MTRTKSIYLALLAVLLSPMVANAIPVDISGQGAADGSWEITLIEGSFNDNSAVLMGQVWWGDASLAIAFADALGPVSGVDNFPDLLIGPLFADSQILLEDALFFAAWSDGSFGAGALRFRATSDDIFDRTFVYATANRLSVPEPSTLALLGLGLVGMAARRRKTV